MTYEILNVELVDRYLEERGVTRKHIIKQLDLDSRGYEFLRGEWMPKDRPRKERILRQLAKLFGVEASDLLLRLEAKKAS